MTWNFCPWCGHRLYQHSNERGCLHIDRRTTPCTSAGCYPNVTEPPGAVHTHEVPVPCDCKRPFSLLAEAAG